MSVILTFYSQMGSVGKSTACANIAHEIAVLGEKVLVIDLSDSSTISEILLKEGIESEVIDSSPTYLPYEYVSNTKLILPTDQNNLKIIPNYPGMIDYFNEITHYTIHDLVIHLRKLHSMDFSYILIDTSSGSGNLEVAALCAANYVITPLNVNSKNITTGLTKILKKISDAQKECNSELRLLGFFLNFYHNDFKWEEATVQMIQDFAHDKSVVFNHKIDLNMDIPRAYFSHKTLRRYFLHSAAIDQYRDLTQEILDKIHAPEKAG